MMTMMTKVRTMRGGAWLVAAALGGLGGCDEARVCEGAEEARAAALAPEAPAEPAGGAAGDEAGDVAAPDGGPVGQVPGDMSVRASVSEGLDPALIRGVVRERIGEIRACYDRGLAADPGLAGRVVIAFTIDAGGGVREASAEEVTIGGDVGACCREAALGWRFPAPTGAKAVSVRYPFVFEPG